MDNNLPDLRDIHLPTDTISVWPLAYGWWLILVFLAVAVLSLLLCRVLLRKSKKRYALKLLSSLDCRFPRSITQMSEILRRICVYKYPSAAPLFGQQWIEFLNAHSSNKLTASGANLLINAPYMNIDNAIMPSKDITALREFCRHWIGENL